MLYRVILMGGCELDCQDIKMLGIHMYGVVTMTYEQKCDWEVESDKQLECVRLLSPHAQTLHIMKTTGGPIFFWRNRHVSKPRRGVVIFRTQTVVIGHLLVVKFMK